MFLKSVFYVWLAGRYLWIFQIRLYIICIPQSYMGHWCIRLFLQAKPLFKLVYSRYEYTLCVCQLVWRFEWLWNFIPMPICKFLTFFIKVQLIFYRWSTFKLLYLIYILVKFNHLSVVTTFPLNELVWRFLVIATLKIISF